MLEISFTQRFLLVYILQSNASRNNPCYFHCFQENFDVVLAHLSEQGDVIVGQGRNGEEVLKFRVSNL